MRHSAGAICGPVHDRLASLVGLDDMRREVGEVTHDARVVVDDPNFRSEDDLSAIVSVPPDLYSRVLHNAASE